MERFDDNEADVPRPSTAREYVRDKLRGDIVSGEIGGGVRLVQTRLASKYNVSTTPVREALVDLASEGLISFDSHRGAVVSQPDMEELWQIFELRRVLEPMVMESAVPKVTAAIADSLDNLCDRMESTRDATEWVQLNRRFHGMFMDLCGKARLASILGSLHDSAVTFVTMTMRFRPEMMQAGNRDHRTIADAARRGDVGAAMACARDHMNITMTAVEDLLPESERTPR